MREGSSDSEVEEEEIRKKEEDCEIKPGGFFISEILSGKST